MQPIRRVRPAGLDLVGWQIREGDPYELSDGHAIRCMTAGGRHGAAHNVGSRVLGTDPAAQGKTGTDVGIAWNDGKNLRAPDIMLTRSDHDLLDGLAEQPGAYWARRAKLSWI